MDKIVPDVKLPDKFSAVIRVALLDLQAVENSTRYAVNMDVWHMPYTERGPMPDETEAKRCSVCLAGAVIACSLGQPFSKVLGPADFDAETNRKLVSLQLLRSREFYRAVRRFGLNQFQDRNWVAARIGNICTTQAACDRLPAYNYDKAGFKRALNDVATGLEHMDL